MRWYKDPWDDIRRCENSMNHLFEDFWGKSPVLLHSGDTCLAPVAKGEDEGDVVWEPYTDIRETEKEILLTADIPGVKKEDIEINVTDEGIEIRAETDLEKDDEKDGFIRRERSYSRYYRGYSLPSAVDPEKADATYNNGVLEIRLPKKTVEKKGKTIDVK